jgi:hypothetical protein
MPKWVNCQASANLLIYKGIAVLLDFSVVLWYNGRVVQGGYSIVTSYRLYRNLRVTLAETLEGLLQNLLWLQALDRHYA